MAIKTYYLFIAIMFCIFPNVSFAQTQTEITLYDVKRLDGIHEVFGISERTALSVPQWEPEKDIAPPLTIKQAVNLAKEWVIKNIPKNQGFDIFSISVRKIRWAGINNRWFYLVDFSRRQGSYGTGEYVSVVILMNGTIVKSASK